MKTLTIKLKQHTPLIHFQHDQEGATLRASEVKPKLDRFLLTKIGKGDYQQGINIAKEKGWLLGNSDHLALNYKMRIAKDSLSNKTEYLIASYINKNNKNNLERKRIKFISSSPYFAQEKENGQIARNLLDWNDIDKKGLIESGDIIITMLSKSDNVTSQIEKHIQAFFLCTNFGTRQSKGFGSFTVTEIIESDVNKDEKKQIPLEEEEKILKENYKFIYKKTIGKSGDILSSIFSTINQDYKLLKSGQSLPYYKKSKMMLYANKNGTSWDKRHIKSKVNGSFKNNSFKPYFLKCELENREFNKPSKNICLYYRAMLGLAEQMEFLLQNPPDNNKNNKMIVKIKNHDIERYQSPLFFKVINNNIFMMGNDVAPELLGKYFDLVVSVQGDNNIKDRKIDGIHTPTNFSLKDFIESAMQDDSFKYKKIK